MINGTRSFSRSKEIDEARMHAALEQLISAFHLDVGYTKVQTAPREFELQTGVGLQSDAYLNHVMQIPLGQGGYAWSHRRSIWTNDYHRDNRFVPFADVEAEGIRSILCVPFVEAGFLIYGAARSQNVFTERVSQYLIDAVGEIWVRATMTSLLYSKPDRENQPVYRHYDCSEREWNILYLLTLGLADEEMAEILDIEASTIRFHLRRLQRKLDCRNRTHLATTALRLGIVI
jgi:DNA-binding CsgD family transcriptional regulator